MHGFMGSISYGSMMLVYLRVNNHVPYSILIIFNKDAKHFNKNRLPIHICEISSDEPQKGAYFCLFSPDQYFINTFPSYQLLEDCYKHLWSLSPKNIISLNAPEHKLTIT